VPPAEPAAVILAGGLGTRLRSAVPDLPKAMAPVAGRPFLAWLLDYWISQGVRRFVLAVGHGHAAIESQFGTAYRGIPLEYSLEVTPLGTGGALLLAAPRLPGTQPFLLLNGDTYFEVGLDALRAFHRQANALWTFALFPPADAQPGLRLRLGPGGRVTGFDAGLANGGVCLVDPALPAAWQRDTRRPLSLDVHLLPAALQSGLALYGLECGGRFLDIGTPEDYRRAPQLIAGAAA
jgi:D-glycero-alpha-D-manno-heptose 1-phosphate guanylyltransferase